MSPETIVRALAVALALAGVETLHGIVRAVLLVPKIGKQRALKLSIVSGSLLAFCVCYLLVPQVGLTTLGERLVLGAFLALFMAAFDLALGKFVMRRSWRKALADLNPASGNFLLFGLVLLFFFPALVAWLRGGG